MDREPAVESPEYTAEPKTIWALPEGDRCDAVKDIFRQAAEKYLEAVQRDDAKAAQEFAITAIRVLSGLFSDTEDPSHRLILSLVAASVAARSGSKDHILLRPGARIPGTKGGYAMATIAAAAVAAVAVLQNKGMSKNAARKAVASILAEHGLSRKRDEHGGQIPITASAIRAWEERPNDYPIVAEAAPEYLKSLEREILARGLSTANETLVFLREQADQHFPTMLAF